MTSPKTPPKGEPDTPEIRWRPVLGYLGSYEVSDRGAVRNRKTARVLRPGKASCGHLHVKLFKEGKGRIFQVHLLVLAAFVGPCPKDLCGLHWDDEPTNNLLGNLRWGSRKDNARDAKRNGRAVPPPVLRGSAKPNAKLSADRVALAKGMRASGLSYAKIAKRLGVSRKTAEDAIKGKTWS